jgi:uncharacterized membrane protein
LLAMGIIWLDDGRIMFSKYRLEALSDGVFAVAMTLLIFDLKVPMDTAPGQLGAALRHTGPEWVSFVVTFSLAAIFWSYQHRVFAVVEKVNTVNLTLMFVFLGCVSVLPFSTSLWGHHLRERLAFALYFLNEFAMATVLTATLELARWQGHLREGAEIGVLRTRLYSTGAVMGVAMAAVWYLPASYWWVLMMFAGAVARAVRWLHRSDAGAVESAPISH